MLKILSYNKENIKSFLKKHAVDNKVITTKDINQTMISVFTSSLNTSKIKVKIMCHPSSIRFLSKVNFNCFVLSLIEYFNKEELDKINNITNHREYNSIVYKFLNRDICICLCKYLDLDLASLFMLNMGRIIDYYCNRSI